MNIMPIMAVMIVICAFALLLTIFGALIAGIVFTGQAIRTWNIHIVKDTCHIIETNIYSVTSEGDPKKSYSLFALYKSPSDNITNYYKSEQAGNKNNLISLQNSKYAINTSHSCYVNYNDEYILMNENYLILNIIGMVICIVILVWISLTLVNNMDPKKYIQESSYQTSINTYNAQLIPNQPGAA